MDTLGNSTHEHLWETSSPTFNGLGIILTSICKTCGMEVEHGLSANFHHTLESTIKPAPDGHYHCWHSTSISLMSMPPQYPRICCHCGEERTFRSGEFVPRTKTHGTMHQLSHEERMIRAFSVPKRPDLY